MRNYYLFVGQNATTGTPNAKTGNLSYYGDVYKFRSLKERNQYIEEKTGFSCQEKIVAGGYQKMRSLNLGSSVINFNEWMKHLTETYPSNIYRNVWINE